MADLTPERLEELRRIAEAATPGPWEWDKYLHLFSATGKPVLTKPFSPDNPDVVEARPEDLDYIENFNPETVLALLDRIEALEAENERLRQIEAAARTLVDTAFEVPAPDEYVYQAVRVDHFDMLAALLKGEGGAPMPDVPERCPFCNSGDRREETWRGRPAYSFSCGTVFYANGEVALRYFSCMNRILTD